jgi:WD40 repeat protein
LAEFADGHFVIREKGVTWAFSKVRPWDMGPREQPLAGKRPMWAYPDLLVRRLPLTFTLEWPPSPGSGTAGSTERIEPVAAFAEGSGLIPPLRGHPWSIDSLAFSPDGQRLVTIGRTGDPDREHPFDYVKLWDVTTRRAEGRLTGVPRTVWRAAFSPDGQRLALAADGPGTIWATRNRRLAFRLGDSPASLRDLAYSPDGRLLATVGERQRVTLWDATTGKRVKDLGGEPVTASYVAFTPDGKQVVTLSNDKEFSVWDLSTGTRARSLTAKDGASAVAIHPRVPRVAFGGWGAVHVLDLATGKAVGRFSHFQGHSRVTAIAYSPDGDLLASAGEERSIIVWDADSGKILLTIRGYREGVDGLAFSPDGKRLATAGRGESIELWDVDGLRAKIRDRPRPAGPTGPKPPPADRRVLKGHADWVWAVVVTPDGKTVASCGRDETVRLWDLATGAEKAVLVGHIEEIDCLALSPDGRTLASASQDREVKLWDLPTGKERATWDVQGTRVTALAFSPDGATLVTASYEGPIKFWDVPTGKLRGQITEGVGPVDAVAFTPDGKTLITGGHVVEWHGGNNWADRAGEVVLWDVKARKAIHRFQGCPGGIRSLAVTSDGGTLLAGCGFDNTVRAYDLRRRKERATWKGHADPVQSVAVMADGRVAASGDWKGVIKFWDTATGRELRSIQAHDFWVTSLAFTPDGQTLVSGSADHTVKSWDVPEANKGNR